ncbi:MAG: hypothetical protein NTY38_06190 [Acidobacteria bacterium]|nr:hypothetical protein [Acidobacteriota bacterium]
MSSVAQITEFGVAGQIAGPLAQRADAHSNPSGTCLELDAQLVARCLAGAETAWEDLIKVHTRRVYSVCYRFTNNSGRAKDRSASGFPA